MSGKDFIPMLKRLTCLSGVTEEMWKDMQLTPEELAESRFGEIQPDDDEDPFCMTF